MMAGMAAKSSSGASRYTVMRREDREAEFSRVLAFSDGVFAIAITLLVLQLEVPEDVNSLGHELSMELPDLFAFAISFAVLGRVWWVFHHRLFSGLASFDSPLIALNFAYLAMVTLVPFTSELLGDFGDRSIVVIIYAVNLAVLNLIGGVMVEYAYAKGLMKPEALDYAEDHRGAAHWVIPGIFLLSVPLALVSPVGATFVWLLTLGVAPRVVRRLRERGKPGV